MDGVQYSTSRSQESFTGSTVSAHTLSRLANLITQADGQRHTHTQQQSACPECDEHFPFATDRLRHQEQDNTLPKPHRCRSCGQSFSLKSSLQLHNCDSSQCECRDSGSSGHAPSCACKTHNRPWSEAIQNQPHGQTHHLDSSPYECVPCGQAFKQKQALLHHQQTQCRKTPSLQDILVRSGNLHNDSSTLTDEESTFTDSSDSLGSDKSSRASKRCQFCSETFCTEASLKHHKMKNHSKEATFKSRKDRMKKESRKTTYSKKTLKSKKVINCRSCEMVFLNTSMLQIHRKEKHRREKIVVRKPNLVVTKERRRRRSFSYPCQLCGKVFVHHLTLRAHYRHQHAAGNAVTVRPPPDQHLTKVFKLSEIRICLSDITRVPAEASAQKIDSILEDMPEDPQNSEEVVQEVDSEYPCPSCAEVFRLQWQLKEHMELHQSSARSGQCSVCTQHMDSCKRPISKRQRLYHCVPCQQGFSTLDSFLQHCQAHLRVRVEEDGIAEGLHKPNGSL